MPVLPARPSLEHLRKQAKAHARTHPGGLARAQFDLARSYGFDSWPRLVRHVHSVGLTGLDRALALADAEALAALIPTEPSAALLTLLSHSDGSPGDIRQCAALLLAAGADPDAEAPAGDDWSTSALYLAVERRDLALVRLLLDRGAHPDEDAFYHACEQPDVAYLEALQGPGLESVTNMVNHKLDFEDAAGLRWFLDHGVDLDGQGCLHWAIGRGRGLAIIELILDAGADVNAVSRRMRPLQTAARCGHLAAYDLLLARGAQAELTRLDEAVLAIARGERTRLPAAKPPLPGFPGTDYSWILGQFALLGRTDVVRALVDSGLAVDSRGWSNFTPLDQAAMNGRADVVALLLERGADVHDCAFTDVFPTPLDCAMWGAGSFRSPDGDYEATVRALIAAGAPASNRSPTGLASVDALLTAYLAS